MTSFTKLDCCRWLPPHAEWIGDGLQCVFACQYGWDRNLSRMLRDTIHQIIYNGTRSDLYSYLQRLENPSILSVRKTSAALVF